MFNWGGQMSKCILVLAILFLVNTTCIAKDNSAELVSFFHLINNPKLYSNHSIQVGGYLLKEDGQYFLCFNSETCYSGGKEKLGIKIDSKDNGELENYLKFTNKCHMIMSGFYRALGSEQSHWPLIGHLTINSKPIFNFTNDYKNINSDCAIANIKD
jgi:hypothetical protein